MSDLDAFATLGLVPRYGLDDEALERRQRELFVARSSEGSAVLERINEAYRVLRDPVSRAELLFELLGWSTKAVSDPGLLEWVFAEREQVAEALARSDEDFLWDWVGSARKRRDALMVALSEILDGAVTPADGGSPADRALVLLEELRYLSSALSAAQQAVEAMEDSVP